MKMSEEADKPVADGPASRSVDSDSLGASTDRQAEVLAELIEIVHREGFEHLRVGALASRLRCSRTTLYRLAPGKRALILLLVDQWFSDVGARVRKAVSEAPDAASRVDAYLVTAVDCLADLTPAFIRDADQDPEVRALIEGHRTIAFEGLRALIQQGIDDGSFRSHDSHVAAAIMDAVLRGMVDQAFLESTQMSVQDAVREAVEIYLRGLLAK